MTEIFLAVSLAGEDRKTFAAWDWEAKPLNFLMTFATPKLMRDFKSGALGWRPVRTMLDSGAFSAWNTGITIDIDKLVAESRDPTWTESVALDVIGDAEGSLRNALAMKAAGSPAFPVFHLGDPWEHLAVYRENFRRVGLSCRFGEPVRTSVAWLEQCFARAWPCAFHSFGWIAPAALNRFPFDTADAISWKMASMYGTWRLGRATEIGFPRRVKLPVRGTFDLVSQVESYMSTQEHLRARWKKELELCRSRFILGDNTKSQSASSTSSTPGLPSQPLASESVESL